MSLLKLPNQDGVTASYQAVLSPFSRLSADVKDCRPLECRIREHPGHISLRHLGSKERLDDSADP